MYRLNILGISGIAFGFALLPVAAFGQHSLKEQLIGTWTLISLENVAPDGEKRYLYGPTPKGILTFQPNGRYVQMFFNRTAVNSNPVIATQARPKKLKRRGTVPKLILEFGLFDADKIVILRPEGHMYPGDVGRDQKRVVSSLTSDELKFTNPGTAAGGKNEIVFRRDK